MLRRSRSLTRSAALAPVVGLLLAGLTACGDDAADPDAIDGPETFAAVEIAGEPGAAPEVTWKDQMAADEPEVKVLVEGDGETVKAGDSVLTHLWVGNGYSREQTYSTWDEGGAQQVTVDEEQLSPIFLEAIEGQKRGSRVAVAASAEEAFGEGGNPGLGIGNKDTVLLIADLAADALTGPEGARRPAPRWVPRLTGPSKAPTGFSFRGVPAPSAALRKAVLIKGEGPKVEKGQTITVDYLGQVYGGKKPFDESFSKEPTSFPIGVGGVVKGWDQGLVGVPIGSRVILAIPPKLGYGKEGNKGAGIKGTDTLYFVVDILGAA